MKNLVKGKIFKKIITILLVIATVLPYFPMSVFAVDNTDEVDIDSLITLTASWKDLSVEEIAQGKKIGTTNDSYALDYYFAFTGSSAGFRNVTFEVTTNKLPNVVDTVTIDGGSSGNGYAMINTGTALSGEASIRFGNIDNQEERKVYVTLKGEYKPANSDNYVNFDKVIELNAQVTPATQKTDYTKIIDWKTNNYGGKEKPTYDSSKASIPDGWYAISVQGTYPIKISSYDLTKSLTLNVTLNRITNGTSRISDGVDIDWGGLIDLFGGQPTVTVNSDGSKTYTFTKDSGASASDLTNAFSVENEYIIKATYTIPNADPRTSNFESSTYLDFVAELQGSGFEKQKVYGQEETITLVNRPNTAIQEQKYVALCGYTPSTHNWKSYQYSATNSSTIYTEDIEALKQNTPIDLSTKVTINRYANGGTYENVAGSLNFSQPILSYTNDQGNYVTKPLTGNDVRLKSVENVGHTPGSSNLVINGNDENFNNSYTVAQGVNVNSFGITMLDHLAHDNAYEITFTINPNSLGLSQTEIDNIVGISFQMETSGLWCYGAGGVFFSYPVGGTLPFSYFDFELSNWDTTTQETQAVDGKITLKMRKPDNAQEYEKVKNENPIFYIGLPDAFSYKYNMRNVKLSGGNNQIQIDYRKIRTDKINGKTYFVIPCNGTYDSSEMEEVKIEISVSKKLNIKSSNEYFVTASMITDNEDYKYERKDNTNELKNLDGLMPASVMERTATVNVVGARMTKAYTSVIINGKESVNLYPDKLENGEKELPAIIESGDTLEIQSGIELRETINNISILGRLPFVNNAQIYDNSEKLIEDGYILPYENPGDFMYDRENKIKGMNKGDVVNQITLDNITINGVYKKNENDIDPVLISPDKYTIYYSTNATANFDSDSSLFQQYIDGTTDLSAVGAKNIKVVFNDSSFIESGDKIYISYEATMPDASGMVGAVSSTRFEKENGTVTTLDAPAAYVINGSTKGDLVVTKKFEDYAEGEAPDGESLQGIVFKLYYYVNGEKLYVKDSNDSDLTAVTGPNGKATFANIPAGDYFLEEVNTFTNYSGIEDPADVQIEEAKTINYLAVNKLKTGTITVNKVWQGAGESQGPVRFTIERNTREGDSNDLSYSKTLETKYDRAIFEEVPYGTYTVTEEKYAGWAPTETSKTVTIDSFTETVGTTFTNVPSRGTVKFVKTINAEDTVDNLTFHIVGRGKITYKDSNNQYVDTDYDITVFTGDSTTPITKTITEGDITANNIVVEKSADNKKVTITLNNVYVGRYNVDEIDIPTLPAPNDDLTKFVTSSTSGELTENGETLSLGMVNSWRTGTIRVVKTAKEGVDLTQFRVRITCPANKSAYGVAYDRTFNIPENGILTVSGLYMGEYTVEEVESDYYYAQYGENKVATPATANVEYGKVSTVQIYNENAVRNVKILKTLEGKDAIETKGIKFRLTGKDATGKAIADDATKPEEGITKTISETTEYEGKTYGIVEFEGIQAGGEYELTELEESVPDYFVPIESMAIDVTKGDGTGTPIILKIDNKRGIGNLEITTKTIPDGGPLSPIVYDVTEIKIGQNNKIQKIGETTRLTAVSGFAEIKNLNAGMYVVELVEIPTGYAKDYPQIVEVPINETAYAEFEIERIDVADSGLTVEKEILNKSENPATAADFENAQLSEDDSFEAIITSEDGNKIYYIFFDKNNPGKLKGLPAGNYTIEEVYKPKYSTTKYSLKNGEDYNQISANNDGKYTFTIADSSSTATIKITNTINTDFGFGGQDTKDNFGKILTETVNKSTRAVFYIADEDGAVVPGAKFKIYDSNGNEVQLSFEDNTYVVSTDKKLFVYGLPVGNYEIREVSETMPEGYEKPANKQFTVYDGATVVTRVEIWKSKPRGKSLTLSTKYIDDNGDEQFTSRSKYKILDKVTGKVLKFEKTASGDYVRSKSASATDTISLRKGSVRVEGIEVGEYQLGLVDLTEQYGVINTEPESLNVTEGSVIDKKVMVEKRAGFKKAVVNTSKNVYALNESGKLYVSSSDSFSNISVTFPEIADVKIKEFATYNGTLVAVDNDGKIWTNYYGYVADSYDTSKLTCISDVAGNPLNGVVIDTVYISGPYSDNIYAIDNNGKVWRWNYSTKEPQNYSQGTILEDAKIIQLATNANYTIAIDDVGKLYFWGNANYPAKLVDDSLKENGNYINEPVCITDCEESSLHNAKIKFIATENAYGYSAYFIDYDGNLWVCGQNGNYGLLELNETDSSYETEPVCVTLTAGNSLYKKKIDYVDCSYEVASAIDSDGKVWSWGHNEDYYAVGSADYNNHYEAQCVSDFTDNELDTVKVKMVSSYRNSVAIDENGDLWFWGDVHYVPLKRSATSIPPEKYDVIENAYFDLFEIDQIKNGMILDKSGRLVKIGSDNVELFINDNTLAPFDVKIKDYAYGSSTLVVDVNGNLWAKGEINKPYAYSGYENDDAKGFDYYRDEKPLCLTSITGSKINNKKIVSVAEGSNNGTYSSVAVIDEDGKIYTAGGKYAYNLGYTPGTDYNDIVKFDCLNDVYEDSLSQDENSFAAAKFTKVMLNAENTAMALDNTGRLWSWGNMDNRALGLNALTSDYQVNGYNCIAPTQVSIPNNAEIVDFAICDNDGIAVDKDGNVYIWGNTSYYSSEISSFVPTAVSGNSTPIEGKKIVKVGVGSNYRVAMDDNGEIFIYGNGSYITTMSLTQAYGIIAKDFYAEKDVLIIKDSEEQIWYIGNGEIIGISQSVSEPQIINGLIKNSLYGLNIVKVIDNNTFIAEEDGKQVLYELSGKEIVNRMVLKQFESHTNTSDLSKSYYVCIDENDQLFIKNNSNNKFTQYILENVTFGSILGVQDDYAFVSAIGKNHIYLITGISESTQARETISTAALNANPSEFTGAWGDTFKSNLSGAGNVVKVGFIQHNNGNLYVRALRSDLSNKTITGVENNTSVTTIKQVTGYTGAKIVDMCMGSNIVLCLDSDKKLWAWGNGCIGNGEAAGSTTPVVIKENIEKIYYDKNHNVAIAIDSSKNVWTWGTGNTGNGTSTGSTTPVQITGIANAKEVVMNTLGIYVLTENGHVWTWGDNRYGQLGSTNRSIITTPVDIVAESGIDAIDQILAYNSYCVDAISTTGKLYGWGYRSSEYRTPTVIDSDSSNAKFDGMYLMKENGIIYKILDTLRITEQYGDIVKQDGKLYNHTADGDTCLNDTEFFESVLSKKFILVKDAKYND